MSAPASLRCTFVVALGLAAVPLCCRCSDGGSAPPATSSASAPAAAHSAPAEAIARCRGGVDRAAGDASAADRFGIVAKACAGLFAERGCRDAWLAAAEAEPSARLSTMAGGCRAAYCPLFQTPKPELCGLRFDRGLSPSALREHWPGFLAAVLERDYGTDRAVAQALLDGMMATTAPRVIEMPSRAESDAGTTQRVVHVRCPAKCELELRDAQGTRLGRWTVSGDGQGTGLGQMAKRAAQGSSGGGVAIEAEPHVRFSVVIAVMDALKSEGLDRISFGVESPPDGGR